MPDASPDYQFHADVWEWSARARWYFVSVPEDLADELDAEHGHRAAGFGSLRVRVTIGDTTWDTSIFPDNGQRTYVLPLKAAVRKAERIEPGATVAVALRVVT